MSKRRKQRLDQRRHPTNRQRSLLDQSLFTYRWNALSPKQVKKVDRLTKTERQLYHQPKSRVPITRRTLPKGRISTMRPFSLTNTFNRTINPIKRLEVCAKRQVRKEVFHALKLNGSGGGSFKPKQLNQNSFIKCFKKRR